LFLGRFFWWCKTEKDRTAGSITAVAVLSRYLMRACDLMADAAIVWVWWTKTALRFMRSGVTHRIRVALI
jgi:hypothetical protein